MKTKQYNGKELDGDKTFTLIPPKSRYFILKIVTFAMNLRRSM
jgi:hypothetical protein